MSVSNIQSEIQNAEQYKIRKQTEAKQAEELQAQQIQPVQKVQQVDEYDKANPVGEEAEGIYSVSHDDNGNLKVNYVQPGEKSEKAGVSGGGAAPADARKNPLRPPRAASPCRTHHGHQSEVFYQRLSRRPASRTQYGHAGCHGLRHLIFVERVCVVSHDPRCHGRQQ